MCEIVKKILGENFFFLLNVFTDNKHFLGMLKDYEYRTCASCKRPDSKPASLSASNFTSCLFNVTFSCVICVFSPVKTRVIRLFVSSLV